MLHSTNDLTPWKRLFLFFHLQISLQASFDYLQENLSVRKTRHSKITGKGLLGVLASSLAGLTSSCGSSICDSAVLEAPPVVLRVVDTF